MLKEFVNTLGRGFATLCTGASTLTLFPTQEVESPSVLDSLNLNMNKSPKVLSNNKLAPWERDSINLAGDWERIGTDIRRVMVRFPLDESLRTGKEKKENIQGIQETCSCLQPQEGTRLSLEYKGVPFVFRYCPSESYDTDSPLTKERGLSNEERIIITINKGFWICETPITQDLWYAVGIQKQRDNCFAGAKLPVENVNWFECEAFVKKLNELNINPTGWRFDLPTEDQWEYACRAGTKDTTDGVSLNEYAWYSGNSGNTTHIVGSKKPNMWGIYDMLGNVWEWTSSQLTSDESLLVIRGGSFFSIASFCCPKVRDVIDPSSRDNNLGFRVVLVPHKST